MDAGALDGHRRFLTALRDACGGHPHAHAHQLAALDRELGLAAEARAGAGYSGAVLELARAASLDRAANHARVAGAVGDHWSARAAALEYTRTLDAGDHDAWIAGLSAGHAGAEELRRRSADARAAFATLLHSLLRLHSSGNELERAELGAQAGVARDALRAADPAFSWARLREQARYLRRTPWTGPGLETVGAWIHELDQGASPEEEEEQEDPLADVEAGIERWRSELERRAPVTADETGVADVVAPYRELAASLSGDDRASAAIRRAADALAAAGSAEPTGPQALARFVADGLLVDLAAAPQLARAAEVLERQAVWPDPLVEQHWRGLAGRLAAARTETEVDLVSVYGEACFAVEADWNALLLASLLAPLRAACTFGWDGGAESRAALAQAAATTYALTGLGPRRLLAVPRIADVVAGILVPLAGDEPGPVAALEGEAGFDLLAEARAWTAARRERGEPDLRDAAALTRALVAVLDGAGVHEPVAAPQPLVLWGQLVQPDDLVPALARPARPPIPGLAGL